MPINREKYISKFIDEGLENVNLVEKLVFDHREESGAEDNFATILRSLHTLKGTSRMLEFKRTEELSHALESVFVSLKEQRVGFGENAIKIIIESLDLLKTAFGMIRETKNDDVDIQKHLEKLAVLASSNEPSPVQDDTGQTEKQTESKTRKDKVKTETVRLSLEKINGIIKDISSLQSMEIAAKSISQSSAALNKMIKEYFKLLKEEKNIDPANLAAFRKLERTSERLNTSLKNYAIDTGNHIRGAYNTVMSLRTLPLSTVFDAYPRHVYQLSQELGKKVRLTINGKDNEIDKTIIESLSEVFMHMVRNSIDHGIEKPEDRLASGKDDTGNLTITCSQESGNIKIVIADDGKGIDIEKIKQKIIRDGLVKEDAASTLTKEELTNFIFKSGFSTSGKISSISGRGVGMDVVRESIEALKGSIVVDSETGAGTSFTIIVPLSIAALSGFPIVSAGMKFIIPSNFVETILLVNREDIAVEDGRTEINYNDRMVKLFYLNRILTIKDKEEHSNDCVFIIIVRSYEEIAAIAVDNITSMKSVILKTMPSFMENIGVFSGIILNEDYEMTAVLHIPTVIKMAKQLVSPA
jgi:chemotaxis protein histidine kinase CheA